MQIAGSASRLITTLFADDTTVYLDANDDFSQLETILRQWCRASGAKFNLAKTLIIPAGLPEYREKVLITRRLNAATIALPQHVKLIPDGTPARVLGAYVGNAVDNLEVWTGTLEKIDQQLRQWAKSHPTHEGKRLIVNMVVGGLTQYLTTVQGMSARVERSIQRRITKFLWDDGQPRIDAVTLDVVARNEAIQIMKLKAYMSPSASRPKWALIADSLIHRNIPRAQNIPEGPARNNVMLQSWTAKLKNHTTLPPLIKEYTAGSDEIQRTAGNTQPPPEAL